MNKFNRTNKNGGMFRGNCPLGGSKWNRTNEPMRVNPDKIILFGSYATGNPNENSDLDLFVIKETDFPRPQRTVQVRKMLYGSMVPIDLIVYTPKEIEESKENKSVSFMKY